MAAIRRTASRGWLPVAVVLVLSASLATATANDGVRSEVALPGAVSRPRVGSKQVASPGIVSVVSLDSARALPGWLSTQDSSGLPDERPDPMAVDAAEMPTLFELDWTHAKMHMGGYDSVVQLHLCGRVASPYALTWQIKSLPPPAGRGLNLQFRNDVLGRSGAAYGADILLDWDISIDGGPFSPLVRDGDTCVTAMFAPGSHVFELRMRGRALQGRWYDPGYYLMQLGHTLVPEL